MEMLLPFRRYEIENFDWVVIPLSQVSRPSSGSRKEQRCAAARKLADEEKEAGRNTSAASSVEGREGESRSDDEVATLKALRDEVEAEVSAMGHTSAYDKKAIVVNKAIEDIGMGRYQWELFALCGLGWFADNLWLQTVAMSLPSLSAEFGVSESLVRFTTLSLFLGLCIGALFWGVTADVVGRRPAFNLTLLGTGVFGVAVGASPTWIGACGLYAALGCFIGGNLPVDGALLLEFLPASSGNLLTFLSIFWPVGQLYSSLAGWGFLTNYPDNQGWRYLNYAMGASTLAMFLCRFLLFHLFESPKFLLSKGRQQEAVIVVRAIAYHNRTKTWISEEILDEVAGVPEDVKDDGISTREILKRTMGKFSTERIAPLFANKKLAINTMLLWVIWACIGMAYPLFNAFILQYIQKVDPNAPPMPPSITYRNYAVGSVVGVPGSAIAAVAVNIKHFGRCGTMALSLLLTGIFLFLFTISSNPSYQLAFNCLVAFFQNMGYGVLYAYSPETFPAPNRSTGSGISSGLNRFAGLLGPLVAIYGGQGNAKVPIYVSGALFLVNAMASCCLPIETMGKQTL